MNIVLYFTVADSLLEKHEASPASFLMPFSCRGVRGGMSGYGYRVTSLGTVNAVRQRILQARCLSSMLAQNCFWVMVIFVMRSRHRDCSTCIKLRQSPKFIYFHCLLSIVELVVLCGNCELWGTVLRKFRFV